MSLIRVELKITGRVQGVGFRQFTAECARHRGIVGWVRNEDDRSVRAVAEGEQRSLEAWIDELRKGPWPARVRDVDVRRGAATGEFRTFDVRY